MARFGEFWELYCTWRPSALTTRPLGQVIKTSIEVDTTSAAVDDVMC